MQDKNSNRVWLMLLISLMLMSIVVGYEFFTKVSPQDQINELLENIETRYKQDSLTLSSFGTSPEIDVEQVPFEIQILDKGTLVYWNEAFAKRGLNHKNHWLKEYKQDSLKIIFSLQLFNESVLDSKVMQQFEVVPRYKYIYQSNGTILMPLNHVELRLAIVAPIQEGWVYHLLWIMWTIAQLLLVMVSLSLLRKTKDLRLYMTLLIGIGVLLWTVFGVYGSDQLFGQHSVAQVQTGGSVIKNMNHFIYGLLYIFMVIGGLNRREFQVQWYNLPPLFRVLVGSIVANGILFFGLFHSEQFVYKGGVKINIEEVLHLTPSGTLFLILMMILCVLYFYAQSLLLKFYHKNAGKIWQRMLAHTVGLCGIGVVTFYLGMQTPILPIALFIIAWYSINDVFSEHKIRNLSYLLLNVILFSAFLSIFVFYIALTKDKAERKLNLQEIFLDLNTSDQKSIESLRDSIIASPLIEQIALLPNPVNLDHQEWVNYVRKIMNAHQWVNTHRISSMELYDKQGISLFSNHISNIQSNNATIVNSRKVSNNFFYMPLKGIKILYFEIENENFEYTPINFIIKLQVNDDKFFRSLEGKNYLVYKEKSLIYSLSSEYLEIDKLDPVSLVTDLDIGDMSYVVHSIGEGYKIIDYHEVAGLIKPISFFSLIFILFSLLLLVATVVNSRYQFLPSELEVKFYNQSSLSSRIQLTVIFLIVFTFVVIGVITTVYFKNIVESNDRTKFKSELRTIINDVQNKITETVDAESASNQMALEFSQIESVYNRPFAYYNQGGLLNLSSESYINSYRRIPYRLLEEVNAEAAQGALRVVSKELDQNQVIVPLYLSENSPVGYLTLYNDVEKTVNSGIYNHLGNLLNVYIFLFFVAGAMSIFTANSITRPLAKLREGVKKFKLGGRNEPLDYSSTDELGVLIKEYNNMTKELEKSAQIIAKTERDMAWREMAKQVAHEIKNPLTPMKLHIQHLENTLKDDPERAREMIKKISGTLIEQINNLSNIASEFSNYATLPKADNERTLINEVIEHVHDLFRERDDMDIIMNEPIEDMEVFADRNHLVRIFVNIIKNAIQAIPQDKRGEIEIDLVRVDNVARVSIKDNGAGISDSMKDKIFTPNFTTKSSGTGLGLAICVNMLDTMNGKIYFDSVIGEGSTFHIEIPIIRGEIQGSSDVFLD